MCGDPPGPFMHAQVFPDPESVLELVTLVHEFELQVDPGVACDTLIVNNDTGWERGNDYLASLHGTRTRAGTLKVLTRDNFGVSLGGYNHAYEECRDQYDYWAFTEDDILISGDQWYARCIERLRRDPGLGFLSLQGLSSDPALHAHGGVGVTRVEVLDAVRDLWGFLPHRRRLESQTDEDHIIFGEVLFTNLIIRLGKTLGAMPLDPPLYTFAYEYLRSVGRGRRFLGARDLLPRALRKVSRVTDALADRLS